MKTLVVCPPTHFDVKYVINPWMAGNEGLVDRQLAADQWHRLMAELAAAGANLLELDGCPPECPDAVFTANAGLALGDLFVPSYFRYTERAAEEEFFIRKFIELGFKLTGLTVLGCREHEAFEGAGDALYDPRRGVLWLGHGFRTTYKFKDILTDALGHLVPRIYPLELVDPNFYHLDTCFCLLDTGHVLWYPDAFSTAARYTIRTWYPDAIAVTEADARRFACNAVSIGEHLVLPLISAELAATLAGLGLQLHQVDMSQYLRSGGACKCLTLELCQL